MGQDTRLKIETETYHEVTNPIFWITSYYKAVCNFVSETTSTQQQHLV
jgi:hypothetical protein